MILVDSVHFVDLSQYLVGIGERAGVREGGPLKPASSKQRGIFHCPGRVVSLTSAGEPRRFSWIVGIRAHSLRWGV